MWKQEPSQRPRTLRGTQLGWVLHLALASMSPPTTTRAKLNSNTGRREGLREWTALHCPLLFNCPSNQQGVNLGWRKAGRE